MECLVTKLKGTVDDATLVRLGETKFEFEKGVTKTLSITPISGTTLSVRIVGDGYFTNSSYSSNNGTELSISERTRLYLSSEVEAIALGDKSNVLKLWITQNEAHLKSGFGALSYLTKMDEIEFHGIGDISDCKTPFNNIYSYIGTMDVNVAYFGKDSKATFASLAKVFPNLTSLMANGTFGSFEGSFAGMSDKITSFNITNTNVVDDIANLAGKTALQEIVMYNCKGITGNIDALSPLVNLTRLSAGISGLSGGDMSKMPAKVDQVVLDGVDATFSWKTTRPSSSYIIAMDNVDFGSDLDAMLINQANCTANKDAHSSEISYSTIKATGTRTSASNSAISTLQSKGYTVDVPEAS